MSGRRTKKKATLRHSPYLSPEDYLTFIELEGFTRGWKKLGLTDEDVMAIQMCIMASPKGSPVVQHAGKLRKARFAPRRWKVGKSGAARICYAYFEEFSVVLLVAIYDKTRTDDLTQEEKRQIKLLLERFESSLKRGKGRREKRDDSAQYR